MPVALLAFLEATPLLFPKAGQHKKVSDSGNSERLQIVSEKEPFRFRHLQMMLSIRVCTCFRTSLLVPKHTRDRTEPSRFMPVSVASIL